MPTMFRFFATIQHASFAMIRCRHTIFRCRAYFRLFRLIILTPLLMMLMFSFAAVLYARCCHIRAASAQNAQPVNDGARLIRAHRYTTRACAFARALPVDLCHHATLIPFFADIRLFSMPFHTLFFISFSIFACWFFHRLFFDDSFAFHVIFAQRPDVSFSMPPGR